MITNKFHSISDNPKYNSQANLGGRTHFVDDETLQYFGGRILSADDKADGRLFVVIHSQHRGFDDRRREFGYAIFDLAGQAISCSGGGGEDKDGNHFKTSATAHKHCAEALAKIDAEQVTADAITYVTRNNERDTVYAARTWNNPFSI